VADGPKTTMLSLSRLSAIVSTIPCPTKWAYRRASCVRKKTPGSSFCGV
jgi:hypothetical protein